MRRAYVWRAAMLALLAAGCATTPVPERPADEPVEMEPPTPAPAPLIESPPLEPVEPPAPPPQQQQPSVAIAPPTTIPPPTTRPAPPPAPAATPPAPVTTAPAPAPAPVETEDTQLIGLLSDLSRYSALSQDDLKREIGTVTQALGRQRTDANRVRLAVLYTLLRGSPQDDQRALQLLDTVTKAGGPPTAVRNLATALQTQVSERLRTTREEQLKGEQAIRKLDQMLELERALLRDRVRSGGGGGGGGGGGSAGGH